MFLVRISINKRAGGRFFLIFIISYCMLSLLIITSPQDTLELLGQILIKRNGLTVKIYIILVCTQQQWALQVTPVGFCS